MAVNLKKLSRKELGTASMNAVHRMWHKDFTLEFSRDRKSMSCYCTPLMKTKLGDEPKMFVKVRTVHMAILQYVLVEGKIFVRHIV